MRSAASILLAFALVGCASPRAAFERLWPGYERAIFEVREGREAGEALPEVRFEARWGGAAEVRYQQEDAIVTETSALADGGARWRRRFVIEALPANRELVIRVPTRSGTGRLLEITVNGAPLDAAPGALESVVQLARDEATVIELNDLARE